MIRKDGYYATRPVLGAAGDFTTAPEISQMFGEMLGLWCVQVWHDQGQPKRKRLVELGPGRGTMMRDALRAAKVAAEFLDGLEVVLVEASPALQQAQAEKLKDCGVKLRWASHFDSSLTDQPLFLLANEFFDAMPLSQYVKTARGWCERMVVVREDELDFALAPTPVPAAIIAASRAGAPDGGVYEVAPAATALAQEIGRVVANKAAAPCLSITAMARPPALAKPCRRWAAINSPMCWPIPARMICPPMWISRRWHKPAGRAARRFMGRASRANSSPIWASPAGRSN